jgi:DNA-binding transcriptional ArsR family regulator
MVASRTPNHLSAIIGEEDIDDITKIFKAMSDSTRVRIVSILSTTNKYTVTEIATILDMSISRVSHQLAKLEDMGFIKGTRDRRRIYYELQDECIRTILRTAKNHISGR